MVITKEVDLPTGFDYLLETFLLLKLLGFQLFETVLVGLIDLVPIVSEHDYLFYFTEVNARTVEVHNTVGFGNNCKLRVN